MQHAWGIQWLPTVCFYLQIPISQSSSCCCAAAFLQGFAKQLAQLFGINAASQGGGSSGRTCLMLQLTADTSTALDAAALQRLQVLLRGELAKEMSSALIARDDTLASLKKDKKQRRR